MHNETNHPIARGLIAMPIQGFIVRVAILALTLLTMLEPQAHADDHPSSDRAKELIDKVTAAVGSYSDLQAMRDVQYTYLFRDNKSFTSDTSTERYLFDGELSWASYSPGLHTKFIFPQEEDSTVVQGWDGSDAWTTLNGQTLIGPEATGFAKFFRKTNFYWFAMMHKLNDPGTMHEYKGTRTVNGVPYEIVELTFVKSDDINLASDIYCLYIHPGTHRVDQFLFTVVDFGLTDPFLMEVRYQRFGDIQLPVVRRYTPALSWDGDVSSEAVWIDQVMTDIRFDNGFTPEDFKAPER